MVACDAICREFSTNANGGYSSHDLGLGSVISKYQAVDDPTTQVLAFAILSGRLEILMLLLFLTPTFCRRCYVWAVRCRNFNAVEVNRKAGGRPVADVCTFGIPIDTGQDRAQSAVPSFH